MVVRAYDAPMAVTDQTAEQLTASEPINAGANRRRSTARLPLEQLSLLIGLIALGLTFSLLSDIPQRSFDFGIFGSRATIILSGAWLFAILLAALTAAGVESIMRSHPRVHLSETQYTAILWILPCILVMGAAVIVPAFREANLYGALAIILACLLLTLVVTSEYYTVDFSDPAYSFARLGLNLATYLVALAIFQTIYALKLRAILSAPLLGFLAGLLALELLRASEADVRRTWLYSFAVALAMGEILWVLSYWNVSALLGGITLLLAFYLLTTFAQQYLWGHLRWRILVEFGFVVAAVVFILWRRLG